MGTAEHVIQLTPESARMAREALWKFVSQWLAGLLSYPGYRDWKGEQLHEHMLAAKLPGYTPPDRADFVFDPETERQYPIVSGYMGLFGAALSVRQTEAYFRRYPFAGLSVSRADHIKTCCELFYSRVYTFKEFWKKHIKTTHRYTRSKKFPLASLVAAIERSFQKEVGIRNAFSHQTAFNEIALSGLGTADLLSLGSEQYMLRVSQGEYRRLANQWRTRVKLAADEADAYVGAAAFIMMLECDFIGLANEAREIIGPSYA